jgi:hypothetical protein
MGHQVVMIEWRDAYGSGGQWQALTDVEAANVDCVTVGIVQDETDDTICVVQTLGTDNRAEDGVYNYFCVPKQMIISQTEMEVV